MEHRTKRNGDDDQREGRRFGPDPETTKALVNIIVEFSGPTESWCPVGYFSPSRTP